MARLRNFWGSMRLIYAGLDNPTSRRWVMIKRRPFCSFPAPSIIFKVRYIAGFNGTGRNRKPFLFLSMVDNRHMATGLTERILQGG